MTVLLDDRFVFGVYVCYIFSKIWCKPFAVVVHCTTPFHGESHIKFFRLTILVTWIAVQSHLYHHHLSSSSHCTRRQNSQFLVLSIKSFSDIFTEIHKKIDLLELSHSLTHETYPSNIMPYKGNWWRIGTCSRRILVAEGGEKVWVCNYKVLLTTYYAIGFDSNGLFFFF
jgi:hypothetical protein